MQCNFVGDSDNGRGGPGDVALRKNILNLEKQKNKNRKNRIKAFIDDGL